MSRQGGQIAVEALLANGAEQIFTVPGESFLPILDALVDAPQIRLTGARQEGGASMMAEAWGKMTGRPGLAMVTRGPGLTNAMSGIHVAAQDSTPLIVLVGLIERGFEGREAFQEIDIAQMFSAHCKWAATVNETTRLPEFIARAYATAMAGRPGPVILGLPEDVLSGYVDAPQTPQVRVAEPAPSAGDMAVFAEKLAAAERPLVIAGGEGWKQAARDALVAFSESWSLPVAVAFRCQDRFDNTHPNYAGIAGLGIDPALGKRIEHSDLIIALGARLGDCTTSSYELLASPKPDQGLVHVHAGAEELGRVYHADLPIHASVGPFLEMAAALEPPKSLPWAEWTRDANADYRAYTDAVTELPGPFNLGEAIIALRDRLGNDAVITNGAGNYAIWVNRYYRYRGYRTQLAPTSGSMGYGVPAAIAAKLAAPESTVVAFAGDGCFQMTCQELGTIAERGLKIIIVVVNNGMYGTIRMHQEMHYPGRVSGTGLGSPDYVSLARAYGLNGVFVEKTDGFMPAIEEALAADRATLIEVRPDTSILTPSKLIS